MILCLQLNNKVFSIFYLYLQHNLIKRKILINTKYYKLIDKIRAEIATNGITTAIIDDLKAMRVMVIAENQPLLAKVIRLIFQHVEEHETFNVAIPDDEPIEGHEEEQVLSTEINPVESLDYLLSSMIDVTKSSNELDIRGFVADLKEQAGEDW